MTSEAKRVWFAGLDPVPIPVCITPDAPEDAILAAACLPCSVFIQTMRPYRLHQPTVDTVELVIGPEGFGAVLLEALQWLAKVTAAGILGTLARDQVSAFVQHYLEQEKPEWRFEELTEHAETFVDDRYQRAASDAAYRQALVDQRDDPTLSGLIVELQTWLRLER